MKHVDKDNKFWGENGIFTKSRWDGAVGEFAEIQERGEKRALMFILGMFALLFLVALIFY